MMGPFVLRRLKSEVLQCLPKKTEELLHVPMVEEQQKLYEAAWSERKTRAAQQQPAGWAALNASDQARVAAAAACDEPLYRAALRRAPEDCRASIV